jgi:hypothetical protein
VSARRFARGERLLERRGRRIPPRKFAEGLIRDYTVEDLRAERTRTLFRRFDLRRGLRDVSDLG